MGRHRRTFVPTWRKIDGKDYGLAMEPNLFTNRDVAESQAKRIRTRMGWSVRIVPVFSGRKHAIYQRRVK